MELPWLRLILTVTLAFHVQVEWDEHSSVERPDRVSMWEIETPESLFVVPTLASNLKRQLSPGIIGEALSIILPASVCHLFGCSFKLTIPLWAYFFDAFYKRIHRELTQSFQHILQQTCGKNIRTILSLSLSLLSSLECFPDYQDSHDLWNDSTGSYSLDVL